MCESWCLFKIFGSERIIVNSGGSIKIGVVVKVGIVSDFICNVYIFVVMVIFLYYYVELIVCSLDK